MSLKFGLNIRKKEGPALKRRKIFDEDDDDGENVTSNGPQMEEISTFSTTKPSPSSTKSSKPVPRSRSPRSGRPPQPPSLKRKDDAEGSFQQDLSSLRTASRQVDEAEAIDASIFDYDSFHDAKSVVTEQKKEVARQEAVERKPKYINNLLDAAARRKQDQLIAREKLLQKEREAEGDEFADKEKFVTDAYKAQQAEARRLEAEEAVKAEAEEKRRLQSGGGLRTFYKNIMDDNERTHQQTVEATAKIEKEGGAGGGEENAKRDNKKSDAELAAEFKARGIDVHVNEEGQIIDKRQLLAAGLNVVSSGRPDGKGGADHLKTSNRPTQSAFPAKNNAMQNASRERQSRMMEEQLAAQAKRAREEEEEERQRLEKAAKSSKTDKDVSDAKARYLARKAAKERRE